MKAVGLGLAAALSGLLAAVAPAVPVAASGAPGATALTQGLRRLVALPGGPPGAIAVVRSASGLDVTTAGFANVTTRQPIGATETVRIASVSKAFNGAVALALVSRGRLSLDDTVAKLVPGLPARWSAITLDQLLHHTSGLPDYIKSPAFVKVFSADPQAQLTPRQLLGFVSDEPLAFRPGSRYAYSDSDNIIVGLMVEAATKGPYEAALARYVTTPLGLSGTSLPADAALSEPYVHGYDVETGPGGARTTEDVSAVLNPALAWASGGMLSTPAELDTFIGAYVGGRLFDAATRTDQLRFVPGNSGPPGPGANAAGLGIFRYETGCGKVYGHTGNLPGYTLFAAANLQGTRSAVVVVNEQLNANPTTPAFTQFRRVEGLAVCASLGR